MSSNLVRYHGGLSVRSTDPTKNFSDINLTGANNLFGSIATSRLPIGGQYAFVPTDGNGGTLNLQDGSGANASWLGLASTNMQFWAYNYCSPLAAVIDRLAEADSNGRITFQNEDKTTVKNVSKNPRLLRIKRLLAKPNPRQTWDEFDTEQIVLCKIFGYCPVFAIGPAGMDKSYTKMLVNLNPFYAIPQFNYNYDLYSYDGVTSNPIIEWRLTVLGKYYTIQSEDIILIKDGNIDATMWQGMLPISKVAGLDYFISNICAAMEADNVLLKKKGPLGVFSYDPRPDIAGWQPMTPQQQNDVQNDLKRYGMTWAQLQYIVSKVPIKWNSMSFNVQELMTKETVRQGIDGICDRFGYPAELMSGKNATYENRNSAEKFLYQNNVIPFSLRRMGIYNDFFELESQTLVQDFTHLPVLQEDILKAGQSFDALSSGINLLWTSGIFTFNQCLQKLNMDTVGGMDIYYNEYVKKYPPPVLKQPKQIKNDPASKN